MKIRIKVQGKESLTEAIHLAVQEQREKERGRAYTFGDDADDAPLYDKLYARWMKLAGKFVADGGGGNDAVTVELDTETKACVVVPITVPKKE